MFNNLYFPHKIPLEPKLITSKFVTFQDRFVLAIQIPHCTKFHTYHYGVDVLGEKMLFGYNVVRENKLYEEKPLEIWIKETVF